MFLPDKEPGHGYGDSVNHTSVQEMKIIYDKMLK